MIPKLFQIGPIPVYSYGLMLAIAFITASYILSIECKRKNISENIAVTVTFLALIGGVVGSKLLFIIEDWNNVKSHLFTTSGLFSPSGLTYYGGLIFAVILIIVYTRLKKVKFLKIADAASPGIAIGYGIARIGCHLSGDGDYGVPVSDFASWVPWGTNYSNGTLPPSEAFKGTEIAKHFPNGVVPDGTLCHPTPIYEFILGVIILIILWRYRKRLTRDGRLFCLMLVLTGIARLMIEFIRLNPKILFGLTEAQLISVLMIIFGGYFFIKLKPVKKQT